MLVVLSIKDWHEHYCFYYPALAIDNQRLQCHIIWKLSSDPQYIIKARAQLDIHEKDPEKLNIRRWDFYEA